MIRVDANETFPIIVALVDDAGNTNSAGEDVNYDVRNIDDSSLIPPISGTLDESTTQQGFYKKELSIPDSGRYMVFATCSGFLTTAEEIIVNEENIYDLVKMNRHYNISVEDVPRTTVSATVSQTTRNVGFGKTDYIVTSIKGDSNMDWSMATASGIVYAHYRSTTDSLPYKMGGSS